MSEQIKRINEISSESKKKLTFSTTKVVNVNSNSDKYIMSLEQLILSLVVYLRICHKKWGKVYLYVKLASSNVSMSYIIFDLTVVVMRLNSRLDCTIISILQS